jgi:hypothetical protein
MQRMFRNVLCAVVVSLVVSGLAFAQASPQPGGSEGGAAPAKPPDTPQKITLEELLARVLKDNPDIRVAEARLREAEAELNRTQLLAAQKAITFHAAWEAAKAKVAAVDADYQRMLKLLPSRAIAQEEVRQAEANLAAAKAELAKVEAELPFLIGSLGKQGEGKPGMSDKGLGEPRYFAGGSSVRGFQFGQNPPSQPVTRSVAEKLRKALETPIKVDYRDKPFTEILAHLADQVPDLSFRNRVSELYSNGNPRLTVQFKEPMPLHAVLQALEDEFNTGARTPPQGGIRSICFVVREYGLLVTPEASIPGGAVLVSDFLRNEAANPFGSPAKSPAAQVVEGTITAIDKDTSLMQIDVGSDAGLKKNQTLDVYRLNPPKYLGTVQIMEVKPATAIGKMLSRTKDEVQVGDHVGTVRPKE